MTTQVEELKDSLIFYKPELYTFQREGIHFLLDEESPHWISTDERGAKILEWVDGRKSLAEILRLYAAFYSLDSGKAWRDVHTFLRETLRTGILLPESIRRTPYLGRSH